MPEKSEENFLEIYDKYVEKIYRYIFFRIGSEESAQDLTSEVFLKSWQYLNQKSKIKNQNFKLEIQRSKMETLNPKDQKMENPRAFLYQVARNLIADTYRQKAKLPISLEEIADTQIADKKDDLGERVDKSLEMETVKKALAELNEDYQEVIIWRYLDELEIKEISEILEKTENAVRVLLSRALSDLKTVLKKL